MLKDILKERALAGMTVFVSTHQLSVAEEMADRIGIMHEGRLIALGTRDELRRQGGTSGALEQTFLTLARARKPTCARSTQTPPPHPLLERMNRPMSTNRAPAPRAASSPLTLLVRVNMQQAWRRLLAIRQQSRLLTALIVLFLGGYAALAFAIFYRGLRFAGSFPGLGAVLIERMLFLLFAFLFGLLLLSNLIISYTNLFRNRETSFCCPSRSWESIFRWKFIESALPGVVGVSVSDCAHAGRVRADSGRAVALLRGDAQVPRPLHHAARRGRVPGWP